MSRPTEQPQSIAKSGPRSAVGGAGTFDRGRAPWGEQVQPIAYCERKDTCLRQEAGRLPKCDSGWRAADAVRARWIVPPAARARDRPDGATLSERAKFNSYFRRGLGYIEAMELALDMACEAPMLENSADERTPSGGGPIDHRACRSIGETEPRRLSDSAHRRRRSWPHSGWRQRGLLTT